MDDAKEAVKVSALDEDVITRRLSPPSYAERRCNAHR